MRNVSAVVIHYEDHQYVERCMDALALLPELKEIVFVDDGSAKSPEQLLGKYEVTFVRHETNRGPIAARNTGAARATGDYLLFVDVDAILAPDYAAKLVSRFEADGRIGVATGTMMDGGSRTWYNVGYDPSRWRDLIQGFFNGAVIATWHVPALRQLLMLLARPFTLNFIPEDVDRDVDWVIERGFMTRRDVFERLDGMDEEYVMFFEGPDYCRRVRAAGYRVIYVPDAVCDHMGGHSHSSGKRASLFLAARKRYFRKWTRASA